MCRRIAAVFLAILFSVRASASVGKLTEVTGPTQIVHLDKKIEGKVGSEIDMLDTIETLKGRVSIEFEDHTQMQITEFSKLKIDEFVYDPASGKGSISMKTSFGTVRYASGLIAKNSRENIKVETPTAKISVRGTDFSMTVSEDGKSLVVLLPSRPIGTGAIPVVGVIEVANMGGSVIMNKAYQATLITSLQTAPTVPVLLEFQDESKINNMILVETPKAVTQVSKDAKKNSNGQGGSDSSDSDSKSNKKASGKSDNNTAVAQVDASASSTAQAKADDVPVEETKVAVLDLSALQPQVLTSVAEAIAKPMATVTTTISSFTMTPSSATVFTVDGTNAVLKLNSGNSIIQYKLKIDTNATFTITDSNGTTVYPLNYGEKLRVNIIQK
jgi:hypothetical protein